MIILKTLAHASLTFLETYSDPTWALYFGINKDEPGSTSVIKANYSRKRAEPKCNCKMG
jgi:hypothetical protein